MKLMCKRIQEGAKIPTFGHKGDAGMDLYSVCETILHKGEAVPVPTGIQMSIPEGYVGLVWDKSGLSLKGVHRLAGVIDSGYRGEIKVVMINLSQTPFTISKGMKIAQMLIQPVIHVEIEETLNLDDTSRGDGGFGSTGLY